MGFRFSTPRGASGWAALLGLLLVPATAGATHYPTGALCYDCHSVSRTKVVLGTHLIKLSPKTVRLGITESDPTIKCLFCHEQDAVSVTGTRDRMFPVWEHFDATSRSKHPASELSSLRSDPDLDCRDCHTGITSMVDTAGNVHGVDAAATVNPLPVRKTLRGISGSPAGTDDELMRSVCLDAGCHGGPADNYFGAHVAKKSHSYTPPATVQFRGITLNDGAAPNDCFDCHGKHNSYQGDSLLTLRSDGSTSNKGPGAPAPDDPATLVTADQCGECHDQDDGGAASPYASRGHGQSAVLGGSLKCSGCHTGEVPHSFSSSAVPGNPLRLGFAVTPAAATSSIRQQAPENELFSICLTCHGEYAGKLHGAAGSYAGCNDCHEPHGVGVTARASGPNPMVRSVIPKVNSAGAAVYGDGASGRTSYEANVFAVASDAYRSDGQGVCDNAECHQGATVNGDALYPLSTLMTGSRHTGGDQADGTQCLGCHQHADSGGMWAAQESCTRCHGMPPTGTPTTAPGYVPPPGYSEANLPHQKHAVDYRFGCQACHQRYTTTPPHNTGGLTTAETWTSAADASYQSVFFDPAWNPRANNAAVPSAADPKQHAVSYDAANYACSNLYCHSDGQTPSSENAAPVRWNAGPQRCNSCHGAGSVEGTLSFGAPTHANGSFQGANSHDRHASYPCSACHATTIRDAAPGDGWTLVTGGPHANGTKELSADGTTAAFQSTPSTAGAAASCTAISCHNGGTATWGAKLSCDACHFRSAAQGGDRDDFASNQTPAAVNSDEWAGAGASCHGRASAFPSGNPAATFAGPAASDPRGCAYCHAFLGTAANPLVNHDVVTNPFRLANRGSLRGTGAEDGGWNDLCLVCHRTGSGGYDPDGTASGYASRNAASPRRIDENHYGAKHTGSPSKGGTFCWDCHDPHGDANHFMIHAGDGSAPGRGVTSASDGTYGVPVTSRPVWLGDVSTATGGGYTSLDLVATAADTVAADGTFQGLCQTCHLGPGGASYYDRDTYTPVASHNRADTTRCTACHAHGRDFAPSCNTCHGDVPGMAVPRGDGSAYPPEGPTAARSGGTVNWAESTAAPASVGAHGSHAATYGLGCSVCHTSTPGTDAAHNTGKSTATLTALAGYGAWSAGAQPGSSSVVDDSCANVTCHDSAYPAASPNQFQSAANPGYRRYWNANLNCYSCHAYDGSAPAAPRPTADALTSGSHGAHVGPASGYAFACTDCHPSNAGNNGHKNGTVNFAVDFGAARNAGLTGGNYDADGIAPFATVAPLTPRQEGATGYFCANLYCHSAGTVRGAAGPASYAQARWTGAATGACGTCHGVDRVRGSMATKAHAKHVSFATGDPVRYCYTCDRCHQAVVAWGGSAYAVSGGALHVNGGNDVGFGANEGSYAASAGGSAAPVGGTCSATYCHSQGLDWSAPVSQGANAPVSLPDWDSASGTLGCGGCHGSATAPAALPRYANDTSIQPGATAYAKKNSHVAHEAFGCDRCHYATTADGAAVTDASKHANRVYDLQPNAAAGVSFTVQVQGGLAGDVYTPTTCVAISCHNGGTAQWGQNLTCGDCHFAAADVDDFTYGNGVTAGLKNAGEWNSSGHGRPSGSNYPSGNPPARFADCTTNCHTESVPHGDAANPFRLTTKGGLGVTDFSAAGAADDNRVCLDCHSATGTARSAATRYVEDAHAGAKHTGTTAGGAFCWDCHDPHGDANAYMVHSGDGSAVGRGVTAASDGTFGKPETSRPVWMGDVSASGYTSSDLVASSKNSVVLDNTYQGLCQTCHEGAGGAAYYDRETFTALASHNGADATRCTVCHRHDRGFAAACNTCHGFPPVTAAEAAAPDLLAENYAGGGGAHGTHVSFLKAKLSGSSDPEELCGPCHGDGAGSSNHGASGQGAGAWPVSARGQVNLAARTQNSWDGMAGDPLAARYGGTALPTRAAAAAVTAANSTCEGVDCHGNPPAAEGLSWSMAVADGAGVSDGRARSGVCEGCHDQTPAGLRVYQRAGATAYSGSAPDAAANYYGTLSGYSRGGHGDARINSTDDPSFVDSDRSHATPLDCTACHDDGAAHFPEASSNLHRLVNTTIEDNGHTSGLCNTCHDQADYPGNHHPSLYGGTPAHDVKPYAGEQAYTAPSTWTDQGGGHYEQNGYSASAWSGNPDRLVDWWGGRAGDGGQDPPPRPVFFGESTSASPKASLPLERYVLGSGTSDRVMCVTCHNPHGTDLYTFDALGGHQAIPDNNMLRLRDADNTLCNACH